MASRKTQLAEAAAALGRMEGLIVLCEKGSGDYAPDLLWAVAKEGCASEVHLHEVSSFIDAGAYMDAAIALLVPPAIWRKYTDDSVSVYGASPFNAAAQERFDGTNQCIPLALAAAALRLWCAPLRKRVYASTSKAIEGAVQ